MKRWVIPYWAVTLLFVVYWQGKKRSNSGVIAELHRRNCNGICYLNTILHFIFWVAAYCRVFILCKTVKIPQGVALRDELILITHYV